MKISVRVSDVFYPSVVASFPDVIFRNSPVLGDVLHKMWVAHVILALLPLPTHPDPTEVHSGVLL